MAGFFLFSGVAMLSIFGISLQFLICPDSGLFHCTVLVSFAFWSVFIICYAGPALSVLGFLVLSYSVLLYMLRRSCCNLFCSSTLWMFLAIGYTSPY
ncbi:hypothetical protein VNO78_13682 [Psophocarpus tetragonolobus]|uniref:Uncharacterized protein n=1 Tax=Psophocarpus tetragonolobus TaxID=3891 RepID=A0AAN9XQL8_PSOTE